MFRLLGPKIDWHWLLRIFTFIHRRFARHLRRWSRAHRKIIKANELSLVPASWTFQHGSPSFSTERRVVVYYLLFIVWIVRLPGCASLQIARMTSASQAHSLEVVKYRSGGYTFVSFAQQTNVSDEERRPSGVESKVPEHLRQKSDHHHFSPWSSSDRHRTVIYVFITLRWVVEC